MNPVVMGEFYGTRICGTRGGDPFVNVTRVEQNGKCPKGTMACGRGQSPENTVCYPPEDLMTSCPITDIDIVEEPYAHELYIKGSHLSLPLPESKALVFSKTTDSLPLTSFKIENAPCLQTEQVSFAKGTETLPNEVMQAGECQKEPNTGKTLDLRYKAAHIFSMSEKDIMVENNIFDRLYRETPVLFN